MSDDQPARSNVWLFVLGGLVIAAGCAIFTYTLVTGIFHITENLVQFVVPGQQDFTLKPDAWYTIFLEEGASTDGKIYPKQSDLKGLTCNVTSRSTGNKIALQDPSSHTNYNIRGRSGHSVLEFRSQEAGAYELACAYDQEAQGLQATLAVGPDIMPAILRLIWRSFAEMFGSMLLGSAIIVFAVLRGKRLQRPIPQGVLPTSR